MTPLSVQFVPIKIDVATDAYKDWSSLFPHEGGKAIPVVYIIRADGEKQYAKTGGLGTAALTDLLNSNLATAGTILNQSQVEQLVGVQEKLARSIKRKKWAAAIDLIIVCVFEKELFLSISSHTTLPFFMLLAFDLLSFCFVVVMCLLFV